MNLPYFQVAFLSFIYISITKHLRWCVINFQTSVTYKAFKFDTDKLRDKKSHQQFSSSLAAKLKNNAEPQIKALGIEVFWETLKNNVKTVAKDVTGTSIKIKTKEWFDEECKSVVWARNAAYHLYLAWPTSSKKQNLDRLNRQVHCTCWRKNKIIWWRW
jgi:hypothetical protein